MSHNSILITGGAGFVGSNLAVSFKRKYPKIRLIAMDNLKRRGSELNLTRLKDAGIEFSHGDIRNPEDFPHGDYTAIIECSAEPSVLAGYEGNPLYVVNTNLAGTINCLENARKNNADIIFLSTSRIYPYEKLNRIETAEGNTRFIWKENQNINGWSQSGISEQFSTDGPRSLYGASKLCSELILQEYISMYGLRAVINRCGVIAGPWQFGKIDQGVFTLWMLAHYFKREGLNYIGFEGKGKQVRDLLHIEDLFNLIDIELKNIDKVNGRIYNVGGGFEISLSLLETTRICEEITGNRISIGRDPVARPADVIIYITDNSRVGSETGWTPKHSAKKIMEDIYRWIKDYEAPLSAIFLS
jgi:CDP-paratose 2-epimerase